MTTRPENYRAVRPHVTVEPEHYLVAAVHDLVAVFDGFTGTVEDVAPMCTSPADTAKRNAYRASFTVPALLAYAERVGGAMSEAAEQMVGDLLSDLMHFCDLFPRDENGDSDFTFDSLLCGARRRYEEEINGE